jgi:dCMP deaminase
MPTGRERPSLDEVMLGMAEKFSERGTCIRRRVGCILINARGEIIGSGYNGPARGEPNCIDNPCEGANYPSGQGLSKCQAIHAEANALIRCRDVYDVHTAYCTLSPCVECTKLLLNSSCRRIVFREEYVHLDSKEWWLRSGREWVHIPANKKI